MVAYDGATGAARWRFPFTELPRQCRFDGIRSTGAGVDAVVLVECNRPPVSRKTDDPNARDAFLIGLDAMTGRLLWTNDGNWWMAYPKVLSPDAVPVLGLDDVGAMDARTGSVRWTKPRAHERDCGDNWFGATAHYVAVLAGCRDELMLYGAADGSARRVYLTSAQDFPAGGHGVSLKTIAVYGDVLVIAARNLDGEPDPAVLVVDAHTGTVTAKPVSESPASGDQAPAGPVVQVNAELGTRDGFAELLLLPTGRFVQAAGVATAIDGVTNAARWVMVGDRAVSASAVVDGRPGTRLVSVSPQGAVDSRPSPCGEDVGGAVPVPGAVLVVCNNEVLGLR